MTIDMRGFYFTWQAVASDLRSIQHYKNAVDMRVRVRKMGTFGGHCGHGIGMMAIGVWHMVNTARSYGCSPSHFEASSPWFLVNPRYFMTKYLELYTIMLFTFISMTTELFISPARHLPWDADGSIPLSHMNSMEHATISLSFFVYAAVALAVDKYELPTPAGLLHTLGALGFAQELLLFHFHSSGAVGLEEHYHWLLQVVVGVSLGSTLLEAACPHMPMLPLLRSASVAMQGVWLIQMAFALWIPSSIPQGCALHRSKNVFVAKCTTPEAIAKAIGMANLHFAWDLLFLMVFTLGLLFYYATNTNTSKQYDIHMTTTTYCNSLSDDDI